MIMNPVFSQVFRRPMRSVFPQSSFSPAVLFANSEPGVWYDPNDIATLFQDTAGNTPVTTPGQTVGLMLDKSGNGFHATRASTSQRPTYGIVPEGGRRNLLLNTDTMATQSRAVTAVAHTISFTGTGTITLSGASTAGPLVGTGAGNRVSLTFTPTAGSLTMTVAGSVTLAQLEVNSTDTAYQLVSTDFDVTEAGVPSLGYLFFDGVDDSMVTPTIAPGIDKAQVFAGVRKLIDPAQRVLAETSNSPGSNDGTISLQAPGSSGSSYRYQSRGTGVISANPSGQAFGFEAPITNVLTGISDISGPVIIIRVNGTQVGQNTASQGTGNYLAHVMFIGSRSGISLRFNGHIHQLITRFGANLDTAQIESTEAYVASKTAGVTL